MLKNAKRFVQNGNKYNALAEIEGALDELSKIEYGLQLKKQQVLEEEKRIKQCLN